MENLDSRLLFFGESSLLFFGDVHDKRESRFTSRKPASVIISKLEEVAERLKLSVRKREAGVV
ncbi:unnamed protein product [Brassica rapa subsp. narinosa]